MLAPCDQPFNKKLAIENANHKPGRNLERRISDYYKMLAQDRFNPSGYKKPGSNKK